MAYKKIVFFNLFHNGDNFIPKGYVRAIIDALPDIEFEYAHVRHPDIIKDIPAKFIPADQLPASLNAKVRIGESPDGSVLYINTWVGCWQGELFPFGEHINNQRLYNIWSKYFAYLKLPISANPDDYLPSIDFNQFDCDNVQKFITEAQLRNQDIILICNGPANSGQSNMGDFGNIVRELSARYPSKRFILTARIDNLRANNIYYTEEITGQQSDLNQIAYLSQSAELIIGKNSGPFTFCQFRDNLQDPDRTFLNFSVLPTDCPSGGSLYAARCVYTPVTDDAKALHLIENLLVNKHLRGTEYLI